MLGTIIKRSREWVRKGNWHRRCSRCKCLACWVGWGRLAKQVQPSTTLASVAEKIENMKSMRCPAARIVKPTKKPQDSRIDMGFPGKRLIEFTVADRQGPDGHSTTKEQPLLSFTAFHLPHCHHGCADCPHRKDQLAKGISSHRNRPTNSLAPCHLVPLQQDAPWLKHTTPSEPHASQ